MSQVLPLLLPLAGAFAQLQGGRTWERALGLRAHSLHERTVTSMELLTLEEIASLFKISRSTVYRMRRDGAFPPGVQVRGRWRWTAMDIRVFIERSKATSSRESCMVSPEYQGAVARGPRRLRVA